jgi:hypothetical protein
MKTTLKHTKNPLIGWDISATATAEKDEKMARAQIFVNDFSEYDETFDEPLSSWQQQLRQQGDYPEDNKVKLIVTDVDGKDTVAEDAWGS